VRAFRGVACAAADAPRPAGRLGGHSQPRTHRGSQKFPGFTITYALLDKLEEAEAASGGARARILNKALVTALLRDAAGAVTGVRYVKDGEQCTACGPVVLATGGFAADYSADGLLARVRPDLLHLPTTNGVHCTGDGVKLAQAAGAGTVDMASVQVHPTGLVHPEEPEAEVKLLAAEALRGVGGIMLDGGGRRFVDELEKRDVVTAAMNKHSGPFRLVLGQAAAREIAWHCKHYVGRGVMKAYADAAALAAEMGLPAEALGRALDEYSAAAAAGRDPFGKKYFKNAPISAHETLHVALITPGARARARRIHRSRAPQSCTTAWAEWQSHRPARCSRRAAARPFPACSQPARWRAASTAVTGWAVTRC